MLWVAAQASIPVEITVRQSRMMRRRPTRSANGAISTEPIPMPASPALSSRPISLPLSFHSAARCGAANAMASTSKPSSMFSTTQAVTAIVWNTLIGDSSIVLRILALTSKILEK